MLLRYGAIVLAIVAAGVVVSRFAPDVGLARPGEGTRAVVADVASVDRTLAEESGFQAFSEALRAAAAARRECPVRNTADGRVLGLADDALDAYSAYREAWQAQLEGAWEPGVLGGRAYWRAIHPELGLADSDAPVTADEIMRAARTRARASLGEALDEVER